MSHGPWTAPPSAVGVELELDVLEVLLRELDDVVAPPLLDVLARDPLDVLLAPELPPGVDVALPELVGPALVDPPGVDPPAVAALEV